MSSPKPFWDLSVSLHDLGIDEIEAFLAGYGIRPATWRAMLPYVRFFNILNYTRHVAVAAEQGDALCLTRYRARVQGAMHLYGA